MQHRGTLGDVPSSGALVEPSTAVGTLDVVGVLRGWRRRQVGQFTAPCQMGLHLLGRPNGCNKFLVLLPPVALLGVRGARLSTRCTTSTVAGLLYHSAALLNHVAFGVRSLEWKK